MTQFKQDISERLDQLKSEKKLNTKKKEFSKIYLGSLSEENGSEIKSLSEFQIAFIDLFTEQNIQLGEQFSQLLKDEIKSLVEPEDLDKINPDEDIGFYCLNVPQQDGTEEWSVELATTFDETIFHAYFNGWKFHSLGLTH